MTVNCVSNQSSIADYFKYTFNFSDPKATTGDQIARAAAMPATIVAGVAIGLVGAILAPFTLSGCGDTPAEKVDSGSDDPDTGSNVPDSGSNVPDLAHEMNSHDPANWEKANWSNGDPFNNTWQPDNISFNNGIMTLTLDNKGCPESCDGKPYASGEYRTSRENYKYGHYQTRMKAASGSGTVSSFFVYTGTWGENDHHEINFEFPGKDCQSVQTNYYVEGEGQHEKMIDLGFDACSDFHTYGFEWTKDSITWYVDEEQVREVKNTKIPYRETKIMTNFWPGIGVDDWLGQFSYPSEPIQAQYDWIRFFPKN